MPYKVQFIGLTYFQALPAATGRRVLLPDGRFPEPDVQQHLASISVRTDQITSTNGWRPDQITADPFETDFALLTASTLDLSSVATEGVFDATNLAPRIPQLQKIDKNFRVNENANWIASLVIRQGHIEALRFPGYPDDGTAPLVAELTIEYDGPITITATEKRGWPARTIVLAPHSEVAIVNASRGLAPRTQVANHFRIYEELSAAPVTLNAPARTFTPVPPSVSHHPAFRCARPATVGPDCTPTCC